MKYLGIYIKDRKMYFLLTAFICGVTAVINYLYSAPLQAGIYAFKISLTVLVIVCAADYVHFYKKHENLQRHCHLKEVHALEEDAALDRPTAGEILLNGKNTVEIKNKELSAFRRNNLGFVFQDFNLLDTFSLKDNIFLPLVLSGEQYPQMMQKLEPIAKKLEITHLLEKYPYEVSGGQKQRAAVARALITQPQLILADEPTGALDSRSTDQLLDLFQSINEDGQTIVMVTHSTKAASRAKRVLFIKDGEVFHQIYKANMSDEEMYAKISAALTVLATGGEQGE